MTDISVSPFAWPPPGPCGGRSARAALSRCRSLDDDEERLALLDEVGGELGAVAGADVPHRVDGLGRHDQGLAGFVRLRRPAVDRVLERAFEDVDDLLARVHVPDGGSLRAELDPILDQLAPGDAEVVVLQ